MAFANHNFPAPTKPYQQITFELNASLFKISVPEQASRNIEDIKRFGVYQSGVEEIDADIHNRWITVMVPILKIKDYFQNGVPVKIKAKTDITRMYDIIQEYCYYWVDALTRQINIGDAPIDELIEYDILAEKLFYYAKYDTGTGCLLPRSIRTMLGERTLGAGLFSSSGALKNDLEPEYIPTDKLERPSMGDFFKKQTSIIRR